MSERRRHQNPLIEEAETSVAHTGEETDNMTQVDDTTSTDETSSENGTSGEVDLDKIQADFSFRAPIALRMICEEKAAAAKLPLTSYLRRLVAQAEGYALQGETSSRKALTEDEKKAKEDAAKAKAKAERELNKRLLEEHRKAKGLVETATPEGEAQPA